MVDTTVLSSETNQTPKQWYFPKRYVVVILGFLAMFNLYAMRVNLSVALVAMVNNTVRSGNGTSNIASECTAQHVTLDSNTGTEYKGVRYSWDPEMQGWVLSSFFYGYCVSGFFGGNAAERFGAARVLGGGIFVTGLLTVLTPVSARWGVEALMVVRSLQGLGEGVAMPAMTTIVSRWSPKLERTRISATILSGITIGTVVTMWVSGWLCSTEFLGGWPSVFYVTGLLTIVWYALWIMFVYETPYDHSYITQDELSLFGKEEKKQKFKVPWKDIFTSVPVLAVTVANFGCLFGAFLLLTELPLFLNTALHFDVNKAGMLSALPYIFYCLSIWSASCIADHLRSSGKFRNSTIRKMLQAVAGYGVGACLLAITVSGCRPYVIVSLFCLSLCFKGFMYSGYNVTPIDMTPDFAGTLYGLVNGVASFSGIIGPSMVGFFTSNGYTIENWNKVFYVTVAIYFASTTFFIAFASAEVQPWGKANNTKCDQDCEMNVRKSENGTKEKIDHVT